MTPLCDLLYGTRLTDNPLAVESDPWITVGGTYRRKPATICVSQTQLSKNMLFIGGTGSGKTNALNLMLRQLRAKMTPQDVMIVFDTKGDFERNFFDAAKGDLILGNSPQYRKRSQMWNIYEDVLVDGWSDEIVGININEISRALFERNKSDSQPFFANAARGVFSAQMRSTIRRAKTDKAIRDSQLSNKALMAFFQNAAMEEYRSLAQSYADLRSVLMYLGDGTSNQALGVLAEVQVMMQDTFLGVFGDVGDFSIRSFVREKGGRTLFLEYDLSIGETLAPLYSLLMDLALKEALGRSEEEGQRGNVYVVLDELKLLPSIMHLDDAVNFGRSMGVKILAGLQSMTQIHDIYGENKGEAILSGFCSVLAFRPNDAKTREYVQSRFGKNMVNEIFDTDQKAISERRQGFTVEDWELSRLVVGEAAIGLDGNPPFRFHFDRFE